uniref:Uncharacterized protein n=1 Tax=Lygus hesperus TaxID=30085 RepID=A0A0A9Z4F0_LYGHE
MAVSVHGFKLQTYGERDVVELHKGLEEPAAFNINRFHGLDDYSLETLIQEPYIHEEIVEGSLVIQDDNIVEEIVDDERVDNGCVNQLSIKEIAGDEIVDNGSVNQLTVKEIVEGVIPENYRLIPHTSYEQLKKAMDTFVASKRHTRDVENIDSFIRDGPKAGSARIDALYRVQAGIKSHIAVQDNDQYWAEQEKLFPHLKQLHAEEATSVEKSSEVGFMSSTFK